MIASGNKIRAQMATQITQDLAKLGIKVYTQPLEFNAYVNRLRNRNWETYLGGFTGGFEPHGGYVIWSVDGRLHSFNQGPQPGQEDIVGWKVADWEQQIDDLYVKASQELDEEKRKELYGQAQQIIAEQLPFLYMVNPLSFEAIRDRIENLEYTPLGGAFWNLYELKIEE
jgi:peptide/nickel transport system substrate-binding protein